MLIADQKINYDDKNKFNAKTAALIGFSIFGKNHNYILNESGEIDYLELNNLLQKFGHSKFLVFGFTNNVYVNLIEKLDNKKLATDFRNGYLLHGGGGKKWKIKRLIMKNLKIFLKAN